MSLRIWNYVLGVGIVCLIPSVASIAQDDIALSLDDANELVEALTPDASKPWRTVPWNIDLLGSQQVAASEDKPIFIWAMDGHPLGCT